MEVQVGPNPDLRCHICLLCIRHSLFLCCKTNVFFFLFLKIFLQFKLKCVQLLGMVNCVVSSNGSCLNSLETTDHCSDNIGGDYSNEGGVFIFYQLFISIYYTNCDKEISRLSLRCYQTHHYSNLNQSDGSLSE